MDLSCASSSLIAQQHFGASKGRPRKTVGRTEKDEVQSRFKTITKKIKSSLTRIYYKNVQANQSKDYKEETSKYARCKSTGMI